MTGQHLVFDGKTKSVAYSRTVMRLPNAQKFDQEQLSAVAITPLQLHDPAKPEVVFREPVEKQPDAEPDNVVLMFTCTPMTLRNLDTLFGAQIATT